MKIKEIEQTAHLAWSPSSMFPVYLATGTAAQQLDASFSTTAQLDLYSLDLGEPGLDMTCKASIPTKHRFHKLVWGSQGMSTGEKPSGVIVGGADQGHMMLFDADKLLNGNNDETGGYLISDSEKHTGPIKALDFNPFQRNLLASGSIDSEIFIWDLNNPAEPMRPGSLSQPLDAVSCLAWNQQVQHILASTFSTRCVVWDLRKNEPIIKVSDSMSRMRCKTVAWHPNVATQLCLASEDDQFPVIQLWDLRYATSPAKTFEGHNQGILSMAWCSQDPDLLLSCGKDNKLLIWNPNSSSPNGEIMSEMTTTSQWSFDVAWCPRNPSVIASASFDGRIGVRSIMGGSELSLQPTGNMIADSFPGMEPLPDVHQQQQTIITHQQLVKPPKWLRPSSRPSFGFGGKLVSFGTEANSKVPQVYISQVVTEEELTTRSQELEAALNSRNLAEFCSSKSQTSSEKDTWNFLGAHFSEAPRQQLLQLLGYEPKDSTAAIATGVDELNLLSGETDTFDTIAHDVATFTIPTDESIDGQISKAIITGDLAAAVDLCFADKRYTDAAFIAMAGPAELLNTTKKRYFALSQGPYSRLIQAVNTCNWQQIVQHCDISNWKEAMAATLTYASDEDFAPLCQTIAQRLEAQPGSMKEAVLCYIGAGNLEKLVDCWSKRADTSTSSLQELVEQVMILQEAQQLLGRQSAGIASGNLTQQLCRYASLLASQGSLQTALTYLNISQEESMVELKERLQYALGLSGAVNAKPSFVNNSYNPYSQQAPSAKPATPKPFYQEPYNLAPTYQQNFFNSAPQQASPFAPAPVAQPVAPSHFNPQQSSQPLPPVQQFQPPPVQQFQPPPVQQFQPPPVQQYQPTPPPPPSQSIAPPPTTGSVTRGAPLSSRNRVYIQDPSVYGANVVRNSASQSNYYNPGQPFPSAPGAFPTQPGMYQTPATNQYDRAPYDPYAVQNNQFNSPPAAMPSQPPLNGPPQPAFNGFTPLVPEPAVAVNATPPLFSQMDQPAMTATPPPAGLTPSVPASTPQPPGWNDPPPMVRNTRPKAEIHVAEAITHPIFGVEPVPQPAAVAAAADSFAAVNQERIFNPANAAPMPTQMPDPTPEPIQPAPMLAPIPSENQIIHDVFAVLKDRCIAQATNPQMKRKLDDVSRKLDSLDDRLRNNGLSTNTIQGLHQIVQSVQSLDYNTSLALHTQLVSTTNFTEIGAFMPGLKVLLQMSAQLGVQCQ